MNARTYTAVLRRSCQVAKVTRQREPNLIAVSNLIQVTEPNGLRFVSNVKDKFNFGKKLESIEFPDISAENFLSKVNNSPRLEIVTVFT